MSRVWFRVGEHGPFPQLHAPGFEGGTDVIEAAEPVGVEALVAKPAVDALDVTVLHGPAWLDVDQFDLAVLGPAQRSIRADYGRSARTPPPPSGRQAPAVFSYHPLQGFLLHAEIRHQLLQRQVLVFHLL